MFQALNVKKEFDGSYKPDGTLTTIIGNVNGTLADNGNNATNDVLGNVLYTSLPDGATVIDMTLLYPKYTDYGLLALASRAEK